MTRSARIHIPICFHRLTYPSRNVLSVNGSPRADSGQSVNCLLMQLQTLKNTSLQVPEAFRTQALGINRLRIPKPRPHLLHPRAVGIQARLTEKEEDQRVELVGKGLPTSKKQLTCHVLQVVYVFLIGRSQRV